MAMLKMIRGRSTKITSNDVAKPIIYEDAHKTAANEEEDSRNEEPEDCATFLLDELAEALFGAYENAENGACLDGRDGPEVESEDGTEGNETATTCLQKDEVQNLSQASPTVTKTDEKNGEEAKMAAAAREKARIEAAQAKKAAQEEEVKKKAAARKQAKIEAAQAKKEAKKEAKEAAAARKQAKKEAAQAKKAAQKEAKKAAAARKQAQIAAAQAQKATQNEEAKMKAAVEAARKQAQIEAAQAKKLQEEAKKAAVAAEAAAVTAAALNQAQIEAELTKRTAQDEAKKTAEMEAARMLLNQLEAEQKLFRESEKTQVMPEENTLSLRCTSLEASEVTSLKSDDSEDTQLTILDVLTGGLFMDQQQGYSTEMSSCVDEVRIEDLPHWNTTSTDSSADTHIPFS